MGDNNIITSDTGDVKVWEGGFIIIFSIVHRSLDLFCSFYIVFAIFNLTAAETTHLSSD